MVGDFVSAAPKNDHLSLILLSVRHSAQLIPPYLPKGLEALCLQHVRPGRMGGL
jgi:hypothetical protein